MFMHSVTTRHHEFRKSIDSNPIPLAKIITNNHLKFNSYWSFGPYGLANFAGTLRILQDRAHRPVGYFAD